MLKQNLQEVLLRGRIELKKVEPQDRELRKNKRPHKHKFKR